MVTLSVSDNGDGTGGVATIAGSTITSANIVYVAPYSASGLTYVNRGSRTGDGTVTLSLGPGIYIGYVQNTDGATVTNSAAILFVLTSIPVPSATGGAPVLASLNAFTPMCFMKVPSGNLIGVNGINQGIMWDGCYNAGTPTSFNLGIAAPTSAPGIAQNAGSGAATAGAYNFYYRYKDFLGNYSTLSPVTVVSAADNDGFTWTFTASGETSRIISRELWRTLSGGANTIYRVSVIADNTTTTYSDTLSDATLTNNALLDPTAVIRLVNDDGTFDAMRFVPPPTNKATCAWFQDRAFYCADVIYTAGSAYVVNNSTGVTGVSTNWTPQMVGRYFYGSNAPRGYLIDSVSTAANSQMTTPGSAPADCVQLVTLPSTITGGTFTLTLDTHTTATIAYNASAATVQAALVALVNIGTGNVNVTGAAGGPYTCTFQGALANTAVDAMTGSGADLSGRTATVTEIVKGSAGGGGGGAGTNEVQVLGFKTVDSSGNIVAGIQSGDGGQFQITFNGHSTPAIAVHPSGAINAGPSAATIQSYLEALPSIGVGNVTVTDIGSSQNFYGNGQMQWQLTFAGALGSEDVPQATITIDPTAASTGLKTICFQGSCTAQVIQQTTVNGSPGTGGSAGAVNEIQSITLPAGTSGGTFTITFNATTTGTIAWNASAATVQAALVAALGANFSVSGSAGGPWNVTFTGTFGGTDVASMTINTASLTGGAVTVAVQVAGGPGANCVQTLFVGTPSAGTFTLTFGGQTTTALAYNATAANIQTALQALSSIGSGNVAVAVGSQTGTFTITFQGALANSVEALIVADMSGLTGAATVSSLTLDTAYGGSTASGISYAVRPAPAERNQIYYSEAGEPESVPTTNTIKLAQYGIRDDEIVGCFVHGPYLYFIQTSRLVYFDYSFDPKLDGSANPLVSRGGFNNRCVDVVDDFAFLMDLEGPYAVDVGGTAAGVKPLGDIIQDFWRNGTIDFSKSSKFFVKCNPVENTARFFYCTPTDTYPRQALCYNYKLDSWWLESYHAEMGAAVLYPLSGVQRVLTGGSNGLVHLTGQGYADGVDSTTETGTLAGTATSATSNTLTDSGATFTSTMVGAPVSIVAGTGKGQTAYIQSVATHTLTLTTNWTTTPDTTSKYVVGAISWTYRTGMLARFITPVAGDSEMPRDVARAVRLAWQPTVNSCLFDIRRYLNNNSAPENNRIDFDDGTGLTYISGDPSATQEMKSFRASQDGVALEAIGFTRCQFDAPGDDFSETDRWIAILLTGYAAQDKVAFYSVEVQGAARN